MSRTKTDLSDDVEVLGLDLLQLAPVRLQSIKRSITVSAVQGRSERIKPQQNPHEVGSRIRTARPTKKRDTGNRQQSQPGQSTHGTDRSGQTRTGKDGSYRFEFAAFVRRGFQRVDLLLQQLLRLQLRLARRRLPITIHTTETSDELIEAQGSTDCFTEPHDTTHTIHACTYQGICPSSSPTQHKWQARHMTEPSGQAMTTENGPASRGVRRPRVRGARPPRSWPRLFSRAPLSAPSPVQGHKQEQPGPRMRCRRGSRADAGTTAATIQPITIRNQPRGTIRHTDSTWNRMNNTTNTSRTSSEMRAFSLASRPLSFCSCPRESLLCSHTKNSKQR